MGGKFSRIKSGQESEGTACPREPIAKITRANRQYRGQPYGACGWPDTMGLVKRPGTKGPIMSYSGLVAYRLSFIDIDGATVVSDPLSSQEFAR